MSEEEEDSGSESLDREFQEVLEELLEDRSLDQFRVEYQNLTHVLRRSRQSRKNLALECRELSARMASGGVKVAAARDLTQGDQMRVTSLKQEIEKAWKLMDAAREKELRTQELVKSLKVEIADLTRLLERGSGLSPDQEHGVSDLLKLKEELASERDQLLSEVVTLREDLTKTSAAQQETEAQKEKIMESISQLQQEVQVRLNEVSRETRRKERLEKELKQMEAEQEAKQEEVKELSRQGERSKEEQQRQELQLREQRCAGPAVCLPGAGGLSPLGEGCMLSSHGPSLASTPIQNLRTILNERAARDLEQIQARNSKVQQENQQHAAGLEQLGLDNHRRASELQVKEEEVSQMRQEIAKLTRSMEATQRRRRQAEEQRLEVEQQTAELRSQTTGLEREMDLSKKQVAVDKKAIDELVRERDVLNKHMTKAVSATEKQRLVVKLHEQSKKNLEQEIAGSRDEARRQREAIRLLERERDRYINEASELTHKVLQFMEVMKDCEMQIFDYKKKIAEAETKLRQQQNLYEAVRADRNLYSKNLIEAQDEITELKRKLKILHHQIDQMKEDISGTESALVKEHLDFQRVEKEKESLKAELQQMNLEAQETKRSIDSHEAEERQLLRMISEAEAEGLRQKRELDQVLGERDVLGTQLVRRNEELALLYERIKIQQSVLNQGERQYSHRLEDIRLLEAQAGALRAQKGLLAEGVDNVGDLRREVYLMQRAVLKQRTRCRALEEELEKHRNVHRWRKLEASDPGTYEMIQKIHSLQKRLIAKSAEVQEKELLIQEKEKLYVELQHTLSQQPGPEAAEQLQIYQQTLREKSKQLKALSSELSVYQAQAQDYRLEKERLTQELQGITRTYLSQRQKEQQSRERQRTLAEVDSSAIPPQLSDGSHFTGEAFSLEHSGQRLA